MNQSVKKSGASTSQSKPTKSSIVSQLEQDIIFGRLHPNQRLVENELINRFTTTRHTIRVAIEKLVNLGLAVHHPNKGAHVKDYSIEQIEELYEIRDVLQTYAIQRMPLPAPAKIIATLEELLRRHHAAEEANAMSDIFEINNAFHDEFFKQCGNTALAEAIRNYAWKTHPIRSRGFLDPYYRDKAIHDHEAIIEALCHCERERLITLNSRHIMRPKDLYVQAHRRLAK